MNRYFRPSKTPVDVIEVIASLPRARRRCVARRHDSQPPRLHTAPDTSSTHTLHAVSAGAGDDLFGLDSVYEVVPGSQSRPLAGCARAHSDAIVSLDGTYMCSIMPRPFTGASRHNVPSSHTTLFGIAYIALHFVVTGAFRSWLYRKPSSASRSFSNTMIFATGSPRFSIYVLLARGAPRLAVLGFVDQPFSHTQKVT